MKTRFSISDMYKDNQYKPMSYDFEYFNNTNSCLIHNSFYDKFLKDIKKETRHLHSNKNKDQSPESFKSKNRVGNGHSHQLKNLMSRQSLDLRDVNGKFNNLNRMSFLKDRDKDKIKDKSKDKIEISFKGSRHRSLIVNRVDNKKSFLNKDPKLVVVHTQKKQIMKEKNSKESSIEKINNKNRPKPIKKSRGWFCCIPIHNNDSKIKAKDNDLEIKGGV